MIEEERPVYQKAENAKYITMHETKRNTWKEINNLKKVDVMFKRRFSAISTPLEKINCVAFPFTMSRSRRTVVMVCYLKRASKECLHGPFSAGFIYPIRV